MPRKTFGPYEVLGLIGRGGLGEVYRAKDDRNGEEVAVKLLAIDSNPDARALKRFRREFEALAELDHPYVVRVIDTGLAEGRPYYAMELIDGLDIRRHLDGVADDVASWRSHDTPRIPGFSGLPESEDEPLPFPGARPLPDARAHNDPAALGEASPVPDDAPSHFARARPQHHGSTASPDLPDSDDESDSDAYAEHSKIGEAVRAFDMDAWLAEPDSDLLLGRTPATSVAPAEFGAAGPAPSIDLPFDHLADTFEPVDQPSAEESVRSHLNNPVRLTRIRELLAQVCDALAYVHAHGRVHRDLKPSNIMVDADGDARLMDFGLIKTIADMSEVTDAGRVVGTYRYMSPEQAAGEPLDARSDLYSLGVILYELLAGRPPFIAKAPMELWQQLLESEPISLIALNPGVDHALAHLAHQLLRKDPIDRLQTAEEVHDELLLLR